MTKSDLIKNLNEDLSKEYSAIIQYTTYAAKVTGPLRPVIAKFFQSEITDEQNHAQFLADKIVMLGGTPTTDVAPVPEVSTIKEMLQEVMKAEQAAIKSYTERSEQAKQLGLLALSLDLEDMVRDETNHSEEVEKILAGTDGILNTANSRNIIGNT